MVTVALVSIIIALSAAVVFLAVRLAMFKAAVRKIGERLDFVLDNDTNIGIDLEIGEKNLILLAKRLNSDIEKLRRLKNEYRKKDIELRESISNISHDLRTPLTVISSYVNLIERGDASISEKSRTALAVIKSRTAAMVALIEELFSYSLYESEQVSLELEEICVNDCLENALTQFYGIVNQCGITPQIDITETPVLKILNAKAFDRIVSNILNNAVKYSDGDLCVSLNESGEIVFCNTASKLNTVAVGKLFNRFFTVEDAEFSTGLGLSIAKILTERMCGEIGAELVDSKLFIRLKF